MQPSFLHGMRQDIHKKEYKKRNRINSFFKRAGDGNRTHVISLEGWSSTIELHPHILFAVFSSATSNTIPPLFINCKCFFEFFLFFSKKLIFVYFPLFSEVYYSSISRSSLATLSICIARYPVSTSSSFTPRLVPTWSQMTCAIPKDSGNFTSI